MKLDPFIEADQAQPLTLEASACGTARHSLASSMRRTYFSLLNAEESKEAKLVVLSD
jgi:hypothetical protein